MELTLLTRISTSIGNFPLGTSFSVMAVIIIFSAPCGYFTFSGTTSTGKLLLAASSCNRAMASGLLFSIPMNAFSAPTNFCRMLMPSITAQACSTMVRWSLVRKGSHSAPLSMMYLQFLPSGILNFTCAGNAAPPNPTKPLS